MYPVQLSLPSLFYSSLAKLSSNVYIQNYACQYWDEKSMVDVHTLPTSSNTVRSARSREAMRRHAASVGRRL